MPRIARIVVPGEPHHIIQRGNRRLPTFFQREDYERYLSLMRTWCDKHQVRIWAYCLMPNHVHLVAVPGNPEGLRLAVGEAHRRYTAAVNKREGWTGYLWQGRFASYVMNETYLLQAARYIERNPVKAGIVDSAEQYEWSSARAHLQGCDDHLVEVAPLLSMVGDWRAFLDSPDDERTQQQLARHERTGRPLGDETFFDRLHHLTGVDFRPQKAGRKKIK